MKWTFNNKSFTMKHTPITLLPHQTLVVDRDIQKMNHPLGYFDETQLSFWAGQPFMYIPQLINHYPLNKNYQ